MAHQVEAAYPTMLIDHTSLIGGGDRDFTSTQAKDKPCAFVGFLSQLHVFGFHNSLA